MKYIIGNWKTNPNTLSEAKEIVKEVKRVANKAVLGGVQPIICPPNVYLSSLATNTTKLVFGVQDVWLNNDNSETGANSALLSKNLGAQVAIIGHSEARARGDTNEVISKKLLNAVKTGFTAVLCVGEISRDSKATYYSEVATQLRESLEGFPASKLVSLIIAYEPVWAIGDKAKSAASPTDFYEMAMLMRRTLTEQFPKDKAFNIPLLYGGSVDKKNAKSFLDIGADGLLIGRSSLKTKDFVEIIDCAITPKKK